MWRQQLSLKTLADRYGKDYVIGACHPRIRKFVAQIYIEELDPFMQWFPWSWFSNMQFIGAGGFSAVYAATISQPYELESSRVALKVIDDKLLNEVSHLCTFPLEKQPQDLSQHALNLTLEGGFPFLFLCLLWVAAGCSRL